MERLGDRGVILNLTEAGLFIKQKPELFGLLLQSAIADIGGDRDDFEKPEETRKRLVPQSGEYQRRIIFDCQERLDRFVEVAGSLNPPIKIK